MWPAMADSSILRMLGGYPQCMCAPQAVHDAHLPQSNAPIHATAFSDKLETAAVDSVDLRMFTGRNCPIKVKFESVPAFKEL